MSNKNTNTAAQNNANETVVDTQEVVLTEQQKTAATAEADQLVQEVMNEGKLKSVKAKAAKRDWVSIAATGAMSAIMVTGDMVVTNIMQKNVHGEDAEQYSALEIAGVATAAAAVGTGLRAAMDFIPQVQRDEAVGLIATSLSGNLAYVGAAFVRDGVLNSIRGKLASVDVEELAEEA